MKKSTERERGREREQRHLKNWKHEGTDVQTVLTLKALKENEMKGLEWKGRKKWFQCIRFEHKKSRQKTTDAAVRHTAGRRRTHLAPIPCAAEDPVAAPCPDADTALSVPLWARRNNSRVTLGSRKSTKKRRGRRRSKEDGGRGRELLVLSAIPPQILGSERLTSNHFYNMEPNVYISQCKTKRKMQCTWRAKVWQHSCACRLIRSLSLLRGQSLSASWFIPCN